MKPMSSIGSPTCASSQSSISAQSLRAEEHVADAEVAVHERAPVGWSPCRRDGLLAQPAERQLERRVRLRRDRAEDLLVALDLVRGRRDARRRRRQLRRGRASRAGCGGSAPARAPSCARQRRARVGVHVFAQQPARQRLAFDAPHEERLAAPSDSSPIHMRLRRRRRPRRTRPSCSAELDRPRDSAFGAPRTSRCRISGSVSARRPRARRRVERPRLARCAAREPPQVVDAHVDAPVWRAMNASMLRSGRRQACTRRQRPTTQRRRRLRRDHRGSAMRRGDSTSLDLVEVLARGRSRRRRRSGTRSCLRRRAWSCPRGGCAAG